MEDPRFVRERRAFTMIELLIVLSLIVMLMGILLPALNGARETSRKSSCQNNMSQLIRCYLNYATDYKDLCPTTIGDPSVVFPSVSNPDNVNNNGRFRWVWQLAAGGYYLNVRCAFRDAVFPIVDPYDDPLLYNSIHSAGLANPKIILFCPSDSRNGGSDNISLVLNGATSPVFWNSNCTFTRTGLIRVDMVVHPSKAIVFQDGDSSPQGDCFADQVTAANGSPMYQPNSTTNTNTVRFRHGTTNVTTGDGVTQTVLINMVAMDGSVRNMTYEVWGAYGGNSYSVTNNFWSDWVSTPFYK